MRYALFFFTTLSVGCLSVGKRALDTPGQGRASEFDARFAAGEFLKAAEIAHGDNRPDLVEKSLFAAKARAFDLPKEFRSGSPKYIAYPEIYTADAGLLIDEMKIGCRYAKNRKFRRMATDDAYRWFYRKWTTPGSYPDYALLAALSEESCPLLDAERLELAKAAMETNDDEMTIRFLGGVVGDLGAFYFAANAAARGYCDRGIRYALATDLADTAVHAIIRVCGAGITQPMALTAVGWKLTNDRRATLLLFASILEGRYEVSFALAAFVSHEKDAVMLICEDAFRSRREHRLIEIMPFHPQYREQVVDWLNENGKPRIAGIVARSPEQVMRAFRTAVNLKKFEDAAEIAEFGIDDTFKKTGPLEAYQEAMKADDKEAAFALRLRYGIVDEVPNAKVQAPKQARKKKCLKTGEWEVKRGCREIKTP